MALKIKKPKKKMTVAGEHVEEWYAGDFKELHLVAAQNGKLLIEQKLKNELDWGIFEIVYGSQEAVINTAGMASIDIIKCFEKALDEMYKHQNDDVKSGATFKTLFHVGGLAGDQFSVDSIEEAEQEAIDQDIEDHENPKLVTKNIDEENPFGPYPVEEKIDDALFIDTEQDGQLKTFGEMFGDAPEASDLKINEKPVKLKKGKSVKFPEGMTVAEQIKATLSPSNDLAKLKFAEKLGEQVQGSSPGSKYVFIARDHDHTTKIAIRVTAENRVSLRLEFTGDITSQAHDFCEMMGMSAANGGHRSVHTGQMGGENLKRWMMFNKAAMSQFGFEWIDYQRDHMIELGA